MNAPELHCFETASSVLRVKALNFNWSRTSTVGTVDSLCNKARPLGYNLVYRLSPQVALSNLRDFRVQAIGCFSVLVCLSWTLCFHLWKHLNLLLFSVLVNKPINDGLGDYDTRRDRI